MAVDMDMSFALRRRNRFAAATPDLQALLSAAAARQAMTPAARAHWRCSAANDAVDPRILMFSGLGNPLGAHSARFVGRRCIS